MSREIMFRAWDKLGELMIYSGENDTHDMDGNERKYWTYLVPGIRAASIFEITVKDSGEIERELVQGELMQFTGLYDSHGQGIYEGDIIRQKTGRSYTETRIVQFRDGAFRFNDQNTDHAGFIYTNQDTEVMGNIYEYPELLR